MSIINTTEQTNVFATFPKEMDDYFQTHEIVIKTVPSEISEDLKIAKTDIQFKCASDYYEYLCKEVDFWKENDKNNTLKDITHADRFLTAKKDFEDAKRLFESGNIHSNPTYYLETSINTIKEGALSSNTDIINSILAIKEKSAYFLRGFKHGIIKDDNSTINTSADDLEGFITALVSREKVKLIYDSVDLEVESFKRVLSETTQSYNILNASYINSYREQQNRISDITAQTNNHLNDLNTNIDTYFKQREERCKELENLYEEKLKLQAPAEYWTQMEKEYTIKGRIWLGVSIGTAILIIVGMIITLSLMPNIFSQESHWFDIFKNSAILTIIASIAIYMLRLFVKLTMSSFHLSRDAKERNKLSYFYLALIEKKAVTEKERAIVLNSLFSRADTGLLKGDSTPTMSNNVTELVNSMTK